MNLISFVQIPVDVPVGIEESPDAISPLNFTIGKNCCRGEWDWPARLVYYNTIRIPQWDTFMRPLECLLDTFLIGDCHNTLNTCTHKDKV